MIAKVFASSSCGRGSGLVMKIRIWGIWSADVSPPLFGFLMNVLPLPLPTGLPYGYVANSGASSASAATSGPAGALSSSGSDDEDDEDEEEDEEAGLL